MNDLLNTLGHTPLPTILVIAGIVFWILAIAGSVAGKIAVEPSKQKAAGAVGSAFIVLGLVLFFAPSPINEGGAKATTENASGSSTSGKVNGPPQVQVTAQSPGYAAVAVDGRGAWGASLDKPTPDAAGADAISRCGGNCRVVMTGRGRCVAFADSSSGGYWYGHAYGDSAGAVRSIALQGCAAGAPAGTCSVKHANCI